jgi:hypothetical protein
LRRGRTWKRFLTRSRRLFLFVPHLEKPMTTLADLRGAARLRLDDVATPYGWSDAELNGWINEAVREAALRAGLNPVAETLSLSVGVSDYELDETIVYLHRARLTSTGQVLTRVTRMALDDRYGNWEDTSGTPSCFLIEGRTLTVYPKPTAADTLALRIEQYPDTLTRDTATVDLEDHDIGPLLEWVVYRAGQKRDSDFTLPNPEQYEANFTRYFGPRPSSKLRRSWLEYGGTSTARSL